MDWLILDAGPAVWYTDTNTVPQPSGGQIDNDWKCFFD